MEQKDYLLREIEKIGAVMRAILNRLTGNTENLAISVENRFEQTKEQLLNETGLDLDEFLKLGFTETREFIRHFNGINIVNLKMLAEILFHSGLKNESDTDKVLLAKALLLYELCNETDKTYSADRENKIRMIKSLHPITKS
jgi:hypothetical protein